MPADLLISLQCGCTLHQIFAGKKRIRPVLYSHIEHSPLDLSLPFQCGIICKQVQLERFRLRLNIRSADTEPPEKEAMVALRIELDDKCFRRQAGIVRLQAQACRPVAVHGVRPAVEIRRYPPVIIRHLFQALPVIRHPPGENTSRHMLLIHVGTKHVDHLEKDVSRFLIFIRPREHLPVGQAVGIGMVSLNILHRDGLPAPGMVDQDLPVDTEGAVKPFLIRLRPDCNITHRIEPALHQTRGLSRADLPEVRQRCVIPEQASVAQLIQLRNADAVFVRRRLLGHDIHCHFGQVQICADAHRCGDARHVQHSADHRHGHEPCRMNPQSLRLFLISREIRVTIDKALVNAVDMDMLFPGITEKNGINP